MPDDLSIGANTAEVLAALTRASSPTTVTIWKFNLEVTDVQSVELPARHKLLTSQTQLGQLCLWAMVMPLGQDHLGRSKRKRKFRVVGTGNPFPDFREWRYLSTTQMGSFVWHVFVDLDEDETWLN